MASSQTIDSTVQQNPNKPVSSGAVYTALQSVSGPVYQRINSIFETITSGGVDNFSTCVIFGPFVSIICDINLPGDLDISTNYFMFGTLKTTESFESLDTTVMSRP
jgi:hypothetical protein